MSSISISDLEKTDLLVDLQDTTIAQISGGRGNYSWGYSYDNNGASWGYSYDGGSGGGSYSHGNYSGGGSGHNYSYSYGGNSHSGGGSGYGHWW